MRWLPGSLAPRLSLPRGPAVDWSNRLTRGLVVLIPGGPADQARRNIVDGTATTRTGTLAQTAGRAGSFPLFGSSQYIDVTQPSGITSTTPCVIFWTQEPRGTTASSAVLDWRASGASNSFLIYESTTAAYNFVVGRRLSASGAHQVTFSSAVGAPTNNRVDNFALLLPNGMDSVTGIRLWRNGAEMIAGTSTSGNNFGTSTTAGFRLGTLLGGTTDPFEGLLGNVGVIARALTAQEMVSLSTNPWQVYANDWRPLWGPSIGGGGGNVSVALTGVSATGSVGNLGPSLSVAASGVSATGSVGTLTANLSVALTGVAATGAVGNLTAVIEGDVTVSLTGVSATGQVGSLGPSLSVSVSGNAATGSVGTLGVSISRALSGVSATGSVGTLTAVGGTAAARQRGLRKTRYTPGRVPVQGAELGRFLQGELERINDGLESPFTHQLLEKLNAEPARKLVGTAQIAYADGTNWDPGSGEGIYAYYGGAWHKLG